jgi:hypothetical protein
MGLDPAIDYLIEIFMFFWIAASRACPRLERGAAMTVVNVSFSWHFFTRSKASIAGTRTEAVRNFHRWL